MDFDIIQSAPEHKSGIAYTPRDGFDELRATFEEFKSANDERLGALERKRGDVLLEEKVDRINAALDTQMKR
ncbi:MAG: phage major capsid protein, partial [Rhizobiales bacterium]|nr:phage major capsid protein [Hyphomicrobiales bacterium]